MTLCTLGECSTICVSVHHTVLCMYLFSLAADLRTSLTSCEVQSEENATWRGRGRERRMERERRGKMKLEREGRSGK